MRAFLLIAAVACASSGSTLGAEAVGAATSLRQPVRQTVAQQPPTNLLLNANVFRDAELTTGANGLLNVTFLDKSALAIGANSTVVVDEFIYNGPGGSGEQILKYAKGAFRFVSGSMPKDKVKIETPSVTIGIRGTIVRTLVDPDGTTTVGLDSGQAIVTSRQTGQSVLLNLGEKVTIKASGEIGGITLGKVEGCPG